MVVCAFAQTTILDFETAATSTVFQYFGSSLDGTFTSVVANPAPGGINTSSMVSDYNKPPGAQTWAGCFSNPNPTTPIQTSGGALIKIKVRMNHIGNLALKLEESTSGQPDWIKIVPNTQINQWQELTFNCALPSDEAPNQVATGTYNKVVLFFDFNSPGTAVNVTSYFDDIIVVGGTPPATFPVNFSVDMNNYGGSFTTVYVSGNLNGWSGNANPLSDPNGDDIWTGTINLPAANYEFKYTIDNWAAQEQFAGGEPCTMTTGGFTNRTLAVTGNTTYPLNCFNSCSICSAALPVVNFAVDMNDYAGSFTTVYVSGIFNSWSGNASPLSDSDGDGVWTGSVSMAAGQYEYKVTLDNWAAQEQFLGTEECTMTTGPFTNRKLTVPAAGLTVPEFCFNSCYLCGEEVVMTFKVGMGNVVPNPAGIWLAGGADFGVPGGRYKMTDPDNNGIFEIVVPRHTGYSTYFTFTNGPCANFSCKENLAGLPCANPNNFNDRFLPAVNDDLIYATCFGQCCDNAQCTYPTLVPVFTTTNVLCNGGNNGAIVLNVTGGSTIYTYNWGGGITSKNRSNLVAGTYTVTITDAIAQQTISESVVISQPDLLVPSAVTTNVLCFGAANGTISLDASGGTPGYSYNWGGGITGPNRTGLAPGTYSATVTDANNCTKTISRTITQPTTLAATATTTNVDCFANATGSINLNPSGGTVSYNFNWNDGANSQNRSGLTAGTYSVTVTDANNCTTVLSKTITQPSELVAAATIFDVPCFGDATGSIFASASGGTTAYNFVWENGATGPNRTGLAAGTYSTTVTDAKNCTTSITRTIGEPEYPLAASANIDNVDCFGNATGQIELEVEGGTAGYTFNWGGGIVSQNRYFLPAGEYFATVTDANNCTMTIFETVIEPAEALQVSASATNPTCGNSNGSIVLTVGGGTSGYTFLWENGSTAQNRSNLTAGTYSVIVTDFNFCTQVSTSVLAASGGAPTVSSNIGNVACFGNATGTINLTVNSGTAPYFFDWGNGIVTQNRTGLAAGTYTVTVTGSNNCTTVLTNVVAEAATALAISATSTNVACFGNQTGSINLNPSGGTPNYAFNWGGGIVSQNRTGLAAGTYSATVTDANGCETTISQTISQPNSALAASAATSNVGCFGNATGSISLGVSGGTAAYSFDWGNGNTSQNRTNLVAGTYSATVTDANGCTTFIEKTITQPASALSATATSTDVFCNGNANGTATASATGGSGAFSYIWTNGSTAANISGLAAGTYFATVSDAENCTAEVSVNISQPTVLALAATATAQTANNLNDGTATASPNGGTTPYIYVWGNGATTATISGLAPGAYSVTATDANGCTAAQTVTVNGFNCNLSAAISGTNSTCFGANNGSATVNLTGAALPVAYNWSNGGTTATVSGLAPGTFLVEILDASGCPATLNINISEPPKLNANATATDPTANGVDDGTASANPTGGTGSYTFEWDNGSNTQTINGLSPATYTVIVTDANGCTAEQSVVVAFFGCVLQANYTVENVSCAGSADGKIAVSLIGGTDPLTYSWSNGQTTATATGLSGGVYVVNIMDALGCEISVTADITEPSVLAASISGQTNTICPNDATGSATAKATGGTSPFQFLWSNGSTDATATGLLPGNYSVVATDGNGCMAITSVIILANDDLPPVLTCPANIARCSDQNKVDYQYPTASDNCSSGGGTWDFVSGLPSGAVFPVGTTTQNFTFTDGSGNTGSCSFEVKIQIAAVVGSYQVSGCFQSCEGTITASGTAGGQAPFVYLWSNGKTGATISGLCDANLGLVVTDAGGCSTAQTVNLTTPPVLAVAAPTVLNDQNSQNIGSINITVQGGTAPFSFKWTKNGSNFATTEDLLNLGAGEYAVVVTDANGCTVAVQNIVVTNLVGTDEPEWAKGMKLVPNPSSGQVQLFFAKILTSEMEISVLDATGRTVFQAISNDGQTVDMNLSHLPEGIYSVRVRSENEAGVRVLAIQR